ncbi:MAG: aminotransferase class V-fold PLP-dependent enzyme [Patescibacteria group bacterium]
MHIAIFGTGYVGLVTGADFACRGVGVTCVDIDVARIANLQKGVMPFFEAGLPELVARGVAAGHLAFTTDGAVAMADADVVFCAVGTPTSDDGRADLSAVFSVADLFAQHAKDGAVLVNKSTVPVGTADACRLRIENASHHPQPLLRQEGSRSVTIVPVAPDGSIDVAAVIAAIRPDTALVSVMYANNEIGTIAPVAEIGKAIEKLRRTTKSAYPVFHTDAAQAAQYLDVDVTRLHVDLMSLSGQKMYGPKATGALFVKRGTPIASILFGGGQEHGLRPGTENVAGIVGFAKALSIAVDDCDDETMRMVALREYFIDELLAIPGTRLNGNRVDRLPNNVNVSFKGVDGEALVMYLDERGIAASTASSCTGPQSMSHVLKALGMSDAEVIGSVRFTLGRQTKKRDITCTVTTIKKILSLLA